MGRKLKGQSIDTIPNQLYAEMGHRLFTAASDAMFVVNGAGEFVEVNAAGCEMVGRTHQALLRLSLPDLFADGLPLERPLPDKPSHHEITGQYTTTLRSKNGRSLSVNVESHPLLDGRFLLVIRPSAITHVHTGRQQTGQETKDLAKFPGENPYPVMRAAQDGVLLYANQAGAGLLENWGCTVGQRLPDTWRQHVLDTLASGLPKEVETAVADRVFSLFIVPLAAEGYVNVYGYDVTDRKQVKRKLRESQEQLAGIIASAMDAIVGFDESQNVVLFNAAAEQMFGHPAADVIGQPHDCLLPERYRAAHWQHIGRFSQSGVINRKMSSKDTLWALRADGQEFPIEASISQVKVGEKILYTAILRDVTEPKQVQAALQDSQEQHQRLFDTMQRGVVYQAADGLILSMNPAAERILGKTKAEFLGETSVSVEHDTLTEDGKPFPGLDHPSMVALRTGEVVRDVPMQVYNPREQQYRLISITAVPLFRDGETEPYQVYTTFDDITERRKAEKTLHQSEERFRVAVKNSHFIPAQYDKELSYQWIYNPYPDFDPAQVIGKRDDELEDSEGAKRLIALKRQVIESGIGVREEISFRRSDSTYVYDFTIEPLYDDNGVVIGGTTAGFDITERKRAEQALYLMSDTQKQIAILDDLEAIYRLVGENIQKLIGDGYTVTSILDEDVQGMRVVSMHGFGRVYENLVHRFKIDPTKMICPVADMTDEELRIYRSGHLEKVEEGMYVLLTRKVPRRICQIVEKQIKVKGTYTMGFVWHGIHYGGISILAKQDITPYIEMIEAIMNQASIAINRIKSEKALRESEEKLRLFVEHAPAALAMYDHEMRYVAASRRWVADYHMGDQDILGRCHYDVFPEITDRWKAIHRRGLSGEVIRADEDEFARADGSVQWLRWEVRPWYTTDGAIGGIVILSEDITERKQTAEALHEWQAILAAAELIAKMGSWKWDLATQKVTWSDEMYDIFGVDRENFDGDVAKVINTRIHPDDIEAVNQSNLSVLENLKPLPLEYRIVLPDGMERIVWTEGRINHDQSGNPVALVGYVQDITERKQAEKALRESEERYHRTLENMLEGCQIIGFDWRYLYLNASVERHGRRRRDELLGRTMMEAYPGIEHTELFAILNRCMTERTAHFLENKFDYDDGSFAWFDLSIQPVPEGLFILSIDITERKRATEALWQSEERFSKAFHLSPAALSLAGSDGRIIDVNENYERMTGYHRDELIGRDGVDLNILTRQQRIDLSQKMLEQGGNLREAELTVRTKSGEMRDVLYSVGIVEIEGKECALTLAFDITERKQMQTTLREMAENMAAAQQMTHYGSWESRLTEDLENLNIWSDECYRIFGYEPGSVRITQDFFFERVHPDDREAVARALDPVIWEGEEVAFQYRLVRPDGSIRTVYDRGKLVVDEHTGRPLKVVGTVRDITEIKEAEAAIAQLNRRMELILNSAGEGIYGSDVNGRITFANPTMGQMTGWEADELLGRDAHAAFHHTRADGTAFPATECSIHHAMQEGHSYHADDDTYWRKDGTPIAVEYTSTPIWEDGQVAGMVMVVKDITERKRAAKEQALLEEQLRQAQKMESIGRLAGGVAHDFNNQLTIIQLYSDLMRSKMAKDDPLLPKLEQIRQAGDHAAGLTRQLLAFSRKQILQPVTLNLNDLVMKLHKMLTRLIGEDITLSTVLEPGLWPVTADPGQIEQVIMNLIINARDAMPVGGLLTIETSNLIFDERITGTHLDAPLGPCVMLAVTDTGQGMDEVTRKQIFEPFFTTKQADKGTGLGLATVHGVIKQSGGAIFVYSELRQGTTFKIYLPANEIAFEHTFDSPVVTTMQHGSETILLVEDEMALRDLVRITLQEVGYTVLEADDTSHALGLMEQYGNEIDLLLTDVVMPHMSGRDLAQALLAQQPRVKVLFMSGYMDDDVLRHGLLTAEVEFLSKPFTRSTLASKVRSVLDKP